MVCGRPQSTRTYDVLRHGLHIFKMCSNEIPFQANWLCVQPLCSLFIHNVAVVKLSRVLCFVVLLWCSFCSFCNSQSCRGEALVRFVIHSVAVVQFSLVLHVMMLLWWSSCSFCNSLCCCGTAPARFEIRNVAVVQLLLMLQFGQIVNASKP